MSDEETFLAVEELRKLQYNVISLSKVRLLNTLFGNYTFFRGIVARSGELQVILFLVCKDPIHFYVEVLFTEHSLL